MSNTLSEQRISSAVVEAQAVMQLVADKLQTSEALHPMVAVVMAQAAEALQ